MSEKAIAPIGDKQIIIETGKLAKQADGAVTIQMGETIVMIAAVAAPVFGSTDRFLTPVESQASADLLDRYDAHARPLAVIYSPFHLAAPDADLPERAPVDLSLLAGQHGHQCDRNAHEHRYSTCGRSQCGSGF